MRKHSKLAQSQRTRFFRRYHSLGSTFQKSLRRSLRRAPECRRCRRFHLLQHNSIRPLPPGPKHSPNSLTLILAQSYTLRSVWSQFVDHHHRLLHHRLLHPRLSLHHRLLYQQRFKGVEVQL